MIRFECDYGEGAAAPVLEALCRTNLEQTPGYGEDLYCEQARERIRALCDAPDAEVQFLVGATQANLTVIDAALKPWQGVLCPDSGHIHVHETGAVEATGHKCLTLPGRNGKITAAQVQAAVDAHRANPTHEHEVQPGMVYISNPTEWGTLYTKNELTELSRVCRACGIYLFVDGARMGYGLASEANDLTLKDYAALCDAFYLGGTKCGALFGEALVLTHPDLAKDFRYAIKQHGGMLAKGWLLGIQFEELFTDGLYFEVGEHANGLAMRLKEGIAALGYPFGSDSPSNQQFPILPNRVLEKLEKDFHWEVNDRPDADHTQIRLVTSWATKPEAVEAFLTALANAKE